MFSNTMAESIDNNNITEDHLKKTIRSYTLRAEGKRRYYENAKERFKENMRKQREATPNSEKEQSNVETINVLGIKKGANCPLF